MAKSVFYSFHYDRDVNRVQLVRNIHALEAQPLRTAQEWEAIERGGDAAVQKWIDEQMAYKKAVIVLVGQQTAGRKWVNYEINKAWTDKKPLLGIRIHGLSSFGSVDSPGSSPFSSTSGIPLFDPTVVGLDGKIDSKKTYEKLVANLDSWADSGIVRS